MVQFHGVFDTLRFELNGKTATLLYTAQLRRWREAIEPALRALLADEVLAIEKVDVLRAAEIAQKPSQMSARDAVHLAVMERNEIGSLVSFDAESDRWPGLKRMYQL